MLGAHVLLDLTRSGVSVRALKRSSADLSVVRKIFSWYSSEADRLFQQIDWFEGDVLDKATLREGLAGVDAVIHAAAKISFDPREHAAMLSENVEGTANIVDLVLEMNIPRFCHVSSVAALGEQDGGLPVDEAFSWKNNRQRSTYSESKFLSEMEVWRGVQEGLECVIVNPSVILGPGNWESGSPRFFRVAGKGLKFYTSGRAGFVDVRDVSSAILALLQTKDWASVKNQRYVLSAENRSYREIFEMIAVALHQPKPNFPANRLMLQLGWRASRLGSLLTGKSPALTRETARNAVKISAYDGSKITGTIGLLYTPIQKTIQDIGSIFLEDNGK